MLAKIGAAVANQKGPCKHYPRQKIYIIFVGLLIINSLIMFLSKPKGDKH